MTMKERIRAAVSAQLSAAADSERKEEIIEELSANLSAKYEDLVAAGTDPEEAFGAAMDTLGDVDELVALAGGPTGRAEFERAVDAIGAKVWEAAKSLEGPMKEMARDVVSAAKAAKEPIKNAGKSIVNAVKNLEISVTVERDRHQFTYSVPADDLTGLDMRVKGGDVDIHLWDEPTIQVIERSGHSLDENKHASFFRRDDGVLCIEQGSTAAGFIFFGFGLFSSDFEVFLPRRMWESITIQSTNGDIDLPDGLEAGTVILTATTGDTKLGRGLTCAALNVTSVSGDMDGEALTAGDMTLRVTTGDIDLALAALPAALDAKVVTGDITLTLPENDGFAIHYHQVTGELSADFDMTTSVSRRDGVASYKGAQTPQYQFSTVTGDIELLKA